MISGLHLTETFCFPIRNLH